MVAEPANILLVRLSHLGDVVQALCVARAVRVRHPRARIAWVVQREFARLLDGEPALDQVIPFERDRGVRGWLDLKQRLDLFAADWTIDAQGNFKSAFVALCARAARRSGLAPLDWQEPLASHVLTDAASRAAGPHHMQRMAALVQHVAGASRNASQPITAQMTAPFVTREERTRAHDFLARYSSGERALVLLHLGRAGDARTWPAAHYAHTARELARDHDVVIFGGPAEVECARALARELVHPRIAHVHQREQEQEHAAHDLRALSALFTVAAERRARFVGGDSGPMHLAWASGLRVTLLAGPQDERRTGPWPAASALDADSPHRVVRASPSPACAPCLRRNCDHPLGNVCMSDLAPAAVIAALAR